MNNREVFRKELLELRFKLMTTKDLALKEEINKQINDVKKSYSKMLLEEIEIEHRKGR